jgi:lantibiotic biosynthesis protein
MPAHLEFLPRLIQRSPVLPLNLNIDEFFILDLLNHTWFRDAIYIASPVLHDAAMKMQGTTPADERNKIISSLTRYYLRMSSRATPFGFFSAVSVADWNDAGHIENDRSYILKARIDMHFIALFLQYLLSFNEVKSNLTYFTNNGLYEVGDELRYVEYKYNGLNKTHTISAIDKVTHLEDTINLTNFGKKYPYIIDELIAKGASEEDAIEYVAELINSQVLVSELELTISGEDVLLPILKILNRIKPKIRNEKIRSAIAVVKKAYNKVNSISDKREADLSKIFNSVKNDLSGLDFEFNTNKLFQVDCIRKPGSDTLDRAIQDELKECIGVLSNLKSGLSKIYLDRFKKLFVQKYEDQEIALVDALDIEIGIDYMGQSDKLDSVIMPEAGFSNKETGRVEIDELSQLLLEKLIECQQNGSYTFALEDLSLPPKDIPLPPSFSVMFQLINSESNQLYIEQVGGVSATNLIGRFTTLNNDVYNIAKDITAKEAENNPEVIYAGIVHLPDDRMGNILFRRRLTKYEIPFLGKPTLGNDFEIPVEDLYISVRNDKIVLRSNSMNTVIVPRLLSAYNYNKSSLPVFHFLCHLQSQNYHTDLGFNWGAGAHFSKFRPRVTYKQHILHPATWQFKKADVQHLHKSTDLLEIAFGDFRKKWKIPASLN